MLCHFSSAHIDFTYEASTAEYSDPISVLTPYGAWLAFDADPSDDTTSEWYREAITNQLFGDSIILEGKFISLNTGSNFRNLSYKQNAACFYNYIGSKANI